MTAIYLQVAPADIAYVKFLFESYEGVAIVRTVDRRAAIIVVLVVPDAIDIARNILREVQTTVSCVEVAAPPVEPDDWLMRAIDE